MLVCLVVLKSGAATAGVLTLVTFEFSRLAWSSYFPFQLYAVSSHVELITFLAALTAIHLNVTIFTHKSDIPLLGIGFNSSEVVKRCF